MVRRAPLYLVAAANHRHHLPFFAISLALYMRYIVKYIRHSCEMLTCFNLLRFYDD
jgi:hypothetical protein